MWPIWRPVRMRLSPASVQSRLELDGHNAARKLHIRIERKNRSKGGVMRKQHIEIGNEEALKGAAKTQMHKRSTEPKTKKASKRQSTATERGRTAAAGRPTRSVEGS